MSVSVGGGGHSSFCVVKMCTPAFVQNAAGKCHEMYKKTFPWNYQLPTCRIRRGANALGRRILYVGHRLVQLVHAKLSVRPPKVFWVHHWDFSTACIRNFGGGGGGGVVTQ